MNAAKVVGCVAIAGLVSAELSASRPYDQPHFVETDYSGSVFVVINGNNNGTTLSPPGSAIVVRPAGMNNNRSSIDSNRSRDCRIWTTGFYVWLAGISTSK